TMDRTLPFSFLDQKVKCGHGRVGAWFDQFLHYPVMAWKNRAGGDKGHTNGVHYQKEARGKALREFATGILQEDLRDCLEGPSLLDRRDHMRNATQVHTEALGLLARLHDLPVQDAAERARLYREELLAAPAWRQLKSAMDLWCACWFWPAESLDVAPLPSTLAQPSPETQAEAARLAEKLRFFHWELEFPDVFRAAGSGFDAILGNPPWDIAKPNSKEFFSNLDPLYRTYGKQEALRAQTGYFADAETERRWLDYNADFRAQSNFMKYAASPFGDPATSEASSDRFSVARGRQNDTLHTHWREIRRRSTGFADPAHPCRHQGSADINLYKTFLEQAHALLRSGGRMGFIIPSGLYSDHGTGSLRRMFLDRCQWEWLFGIENREGIFEIHRSFKFNPIIIHKGGTTTAIRTAFMRRKLEDWERAEEFATAYTRTQIDRFSPRSQAILEI
ncbi:MAG: Eco57I restriction-modification methylase domain-containing protein, partial [Planctomyces sp.]